MIVLDASMLIALLDANDRHHAKARTALADASDDMAINVLTLAEVAVGPARLDRLADVSTAAELLGLRVAPLDGPDWDHLARLRADTGLRLPDCCVLLTAVQESAVLATFDRRLGRSAREAGLRTLEP